MVTTALNSNLTNTDNSFVTAKTERLAKPWKVSNQLIAFIGEWESGTLNGKNWRGQDVVDGMILKVYDDGSGFPTVGMGHLVVPKDKLKIGDIISLEKARELARIDLDKVVEAINNSVKVPLYQYEFDALVSLLFNTGYGKNKKKHETVNRVDIIANILNKGGYNEIPKFIENFVAKVVPARRKTEARIFKDGVYNAKH